MKVRGRFPRGKRGLKYVNISTGDSTTAGRFPRGKRGLKFVLHKTAQSRK